MNKTHSILLSSIVSGFLALSPVAKAEEPGAPATGAPANVGAPAIGGAPAKDDKALITKKEHPKKHCECGDCKKHKCDKKECEHCSGHVKNAGKEGEAKKE